MNHRLRKKIFRQTSIRYVKEYRFGDRKHVNYIIFPRAWYIKKMREMGHYERQTMLL